MAKTSDTNQRWENLSLLDVLKPEPGWRVDHAMLATYSADLAVVVACLMAMAGLSDDRGSGSRIDFATSFERLRHRVRVMVQAGRISLPARRSPVLNVLDQILVEMREDEANCSWHPKMALIRLVPDAEAQEEAQGIRYSFWLGSRNLTRDLSWDAGLVLRGEVNGKGAAVPGIVEAGQKLAEHASFADLKPATVKRELAQVRWETPAGFTVEQVTLLSPRDSRTLPAEPTGLRSLTVVSPFLDGTTIGKLGKWGDEHTHRTLLSTRMELCTLVGQKGRPLDGFHQLLTLEPPAPEASGAVLGETIGTSQDVEEDSSVRAGLDPDQEEDPEFNGLHAKLIYAEHAGGRTLWMGSANATQRAWNGPNAEAFAQLKVPESVGAGLRAFLDETVPVDRKALEAPAAESEDEKRLEEARKKIVAGWAASQKPSAAGPVLSNPESPLPPGASIRLEVALLWCDFVPWPRGKASVQLPPIQPYQETELIQLRLTRGSLSCVWVAKAPSTPPIGEERDRQALANYMDPRTFLAWIRSLLTDDLVPGGDDWDADGVASRANATTWRKGAYDVLAPTLEDMLKSCSREPERFREAGRQVDRYLDLITRRDGRLDPQLQKTLAEFKDTWRLMRTNLLK